MHRTPPPTPERVQGVQHPVYYINEVHKLLHAVLIASRKMCHYFQAHKISVVTSYPMKTMLHNPNETRNIAKWAAELAEFGLDFIPCHAIKSQVLADFVEDWTPPVCHPGGPDIGELEVKAPVFTEPHWRLFFYGSSRKQGARAGVLLLTLSGVQFKYMVHLDIKATNNIAEYEALIFVLCIILSLRVRQLIVKGDS
jgi:hypothetical protein